jgi:3-dehydroquinate synthase
MLYVLLFLHFSGCKYKRILLKKKLVYKSASPIFVILYKNTVITIKASGYNVFLGDDAFDALSEYLNAEKFSKIFILVDEKTLRNCLPELLKNVGELGGAEIIETESGEENKTIEVCIQLWKVLTELGADRHSLLINLGGGVIGDLGGFTAACFKRGIRYINIPTTLLAQVDASIGGKTGIDLENLKNQIGLFSDPQAVFIYPPFLKTLSKRQILSGLTESVKHALIADAVYWQELKKFKPAKPDWISITERSVNIKNEVVKQDPHEKGLRKILNFGHTAGHAIETLYLEKGDPVLHGEAVAAGIVIETYLSYKNAGLPHTELDDICSFIMKMFAPPEIEQQDFTRLIELMEQDKKNDGAGINFSLLKETGKAEYNTVCSSKMIFEAFNFYMLQCSLNSPSQKQ